MADSKDIRVAAIVAAAEGVFFRYGFKKTSMDDLARAAGLSRQGLYLYFPTKEALFKETVSVALASMRASQRKALAKKDAPIEARLLEVFTIFVSFDSENMDELLAAAKEIVGDAMNDVEMAVIADLTKALRAADVPARWKDLGLSAKDLAQHLMAAFHGVKHQSKSPADFAARMRVAIRLVCRGGPS